MKRTFGRNTDGTISVCTAKPENKGKGRCFHTDHVVSEIDDSQVQAYNERILSENLGNIPTVRKSASQTKTFYDDRYTSPSGEGSLSREELSEASSRISEQFSNEDYAFIKEFYQKYGERLSNARIVQAYENSSENIYAFLTSDDPVAVKTRSFIGPDVDMKVFSRIIVSNVGAMTAEERWKNDGRYVSVDRIILTSVLNDMNKERYIASVLFFGGRCCYCQTPFTMPGSGGKRVPSGEHLTPISPETPPPYCAATKFGNVALACVGCNSSRGNKDLKEWVSETRRIPEEKKQDVLDRIAAFRRFALYKELDDRQVHAIRSSIGQIKKQIKIEKQHMIQDGRRRKFAPESAKRIKSVIYHETDVLRKKLR